MTDFRLHRGDAIDVLRNMADNSVDSIVTDPPYGLKFMSKHWDYDLPSVETWRQCLRVLKPGGHLLAFAGTRTQHRMAVRIEDAGFEIRDMIAWMYGSGFPKSLDVSKAIDKAAGAVRERSPTVAMQKKGEVGEISKNLRCAICGKARASGNPCVCPRLEDEPVTEAGREWSGWGTALKPAMEPVTVARKPLEHNTVAANVLAHGTGAINIDASRVPLTSPADAAGFANNHAVTERLPDSYDGEPLGLHDGGWKQRVGPAVVPTGRWPANVIHDGSDEVITAFPDLGKSGVAVQRNGGGQKIGGNGIYQGSEGLTRADSGFADAGSAARFFYAAKASRKDRGEGNTHPTVKPTALMRYLCRLVTPAGGTVLDPFVGSGSTGKAAILEGFRFIGIDRDADEDGNSLGYLDIARARIVHAGGAERCEGGPTTGSLANAITRLNAAVEGLLSALACFRASAQSTTGSTDNNEDEL